jgi:ABC-type multidrug transport system ATPase subunit
LSILTGELEPSAGSATINGFDVVSERNSVRQELGYCPQFDPLLDLLSAREHLTLYGRIRGLPEEKLTPLVDGLIDKLGLGPFADNISQTYSGGNKRKLSLAVALIGSPTVIFLDGKPQRQQF